MGPLSPAQLEAIRAKMPAHERHLLRLDGLLEPELPLLNLCGGLIAPYFVDEVCAPARQERRGVQRNGRDSD